MELDTRIKRDRSHPALEVEGESNSDEQEKTERTIRKSDMI